MRMQIVRVDLASRRRWRTHMDVVSWWLGGSPSSAVDPGALDLGADLRSVQRFSRHADRRTLIRHDDVGRDLGGDVAPLVGASLTAGGSGETFE
jgi:hypothetical protein